VDVAFFRTVCQIAGREFGIIDHNLFIVFTELVPAMQSVISQPPRPAPAEAPPSSHPRSDSPSSNGTSNGMYRPASDFRS